MGARIEFFPVDNGDMTLVTLESGRRLLIDCKIRAAADDSSDDAPDVGKFLRERLEIDEDGRPYVDVFVLTHPDHDHCAGLREHFHLGALKSRQKTAETVVIREMWSAPIVFRRKSRIEALSEDAEAWCDEARRRVNAHREGTGDVDGDRIVVLGHDVDHKSDGLEEITIGVGDSTEIICGEQDGTFSATLLGPLDQGKNEDEEELLAKNRSSVILQLRIAADDVADACLLLVGGDAGVAIWERQWHRLGKDPADLTYDVLLTPHHCSLHSLSYGSWSEEGENVEISADALAALGQARDGAVLIASSKKITDDNSDPPCVRAEREYVAIADAIGGEFICVADHVADGDQDVLCIEVTGENRKVRKSGGSGGGPLPFNPPRPQKTEKQGGGRYAS